jgi:sigma-E factor negative regulatory protein RseA
MSEQLKESLSAVMDGEADEFEIRRVLNEAAEDAELRGVWERYHLVRSVMRGEGRKLGAGTLGREFWAQIDADVVTAGSEVVPIESEPETSHGTSRLSWNQRIAGIAVAAGVAAAVVIGFGGGNFGGSDRGNDTVAPSPQVAQVRTSDVPTTQAALVDDEGRPIDDVYPSASDLQRAQAYMLHHAHQVALTNQARTVPFVKVAAFQSR